jgi:lipopolysaccharide/colanic/teichoic acid biosynthesis glycosyltransferase
LCGDPAAELGHAAAVVSLSAGLGAGGIAVQTWSEGWKKHMFKRCFDLFWAAFGLLLLLPVFATVAVLIKCTSRGPVFYRGERIGRFGKPFRVFKFRTMIADAEKRGPVGTAADDARVTPVGSVLRKCKIDELPQLINVLLGDMSLVGPRPEAAIYFEYYSREEKQLIWSVRPGITDYASLFFHDESAWMAGATDIVRDYITRIKDKKVQLQMEYVRKQSFWVDVAIILATLRTILVTRLGLGAPRSS